MKFLRSFIAQKLWILIALLFIQCSSEKKTEEIAQPPNIVMIISDDQAWSDYSFLGHPHIQTPRIDQLARESLTFTRGYVSAPLCSPSLATLITGLYPHQHGITGNDPTIPHEPGERYKPGWREKRAAAFTAVKNQFNQLPLLTKRLEKLDYLSLQTGKWWLGSALEGHFTEGMTHGDHTRGGRHGDEGLKIGREGLQPIYDFIEKSTEKNKPFFVWYAPFLPHSPHTPPKELEEKYTDLAPTPAVARYWAMCEWFDQTCGDLLDHLDERDLSRETLVIYVCDNGWIQDPDKPNRFAPRSKQSPYEGGIRTPLMYRWTGKIKPRMDSLHLASSIDIVPTILTACGLEADPSLPGINVLDDQAINLRTTIFAEAYEHDIKDLNEPTRSLKYRVGLEYPWKLIVPDSSNMPEEQMQLFDIVKDPTEQHDMSGANPEVVASLSKKIDQWWLPPHLQN